MNQSNKLRSCFNLLAMVAVAWLLTGCMHTSPRSSEIRGRVLDAKTHLPIKGAKVCFCDPPYHAIYTDTDGYFVMKATKNFHWGVNPASGDIPSPKQHSLCISHKGYATRSFWGGDALNILMQPEQSPTS